MRHIETESTLFEKLERIGEAHKGTGALPHTDFGVFCDLLRGTIDGVSGRLGVTPFQAALYGDLICLLSGAEITLQQLAAHINCPVKEIYKYFQEIEVLEDRDLLTVSETRYGAQAKTIIIDMSTVNDLCSSAFLDDGDCGDLTGDDFFAGVVKIIQERLSKKWSHARCVRKVQNLLNRYPHLSMVQKILSYRLDQSEVFVLLGCCYFTMYDLRIEIEIRQIEGLFDSPSDAVPLRRKLSMGKSDLQRLGLIENYCENRMAKMHQYALTGKAKEDLLSGLALSETETGSDLISPEAVTEKALFYPENTTAKIDELQAILSAERFADIQKNLAANGMRTGFACLFSGGPGTGKTETAMQLARRTGRAIFKVDIAETKSMWFGESEKVIKRVFTRYRRTLQNSSLAPVLLFNEADAVISKRRDVNAGNCAPTENAIQNIILEEIENLSGILIATTNLTENMDSAFERRFLYKINFEKPTIEARKNIWLSNLQTLSAEDAGTLASRFDFSGGQIENIARKAAVYSIIHSAAPPLEKIIEYCGDESLDTAGGRRIGFRAE